MSDDDLRKRKERDAETCEAETLVGGIDTPIPLSCTNCGEQLFHSEELSKLYGMATSKCNMCGCHWSFGKMMN